jgi:hypothetical protein
MVRLEDLVAYVGTTAAITAAVAVSMCASGPARPAPQAPAADAAPGRIGVVRPIREIPEEYRRELAMGLAACFDPLNPPTQEMIDEVNALYMFNDRYNAPSRWSTTASGTTGSQGDGATLLWSFVPDGLSIPNGVGEGVANSNMFATMDSRFASNGGRAAWIQAFVRSFQRWEALSGNTYIRVTVGGNDWDDGAGWSSSGAIGLRGDVRISMKPIDGGSGVLAYNSFPGGGSGGNMVLDSGETWNSGASGNTPFRFLRNTIMHEHGHGLGFNHTCSTNSGILMEPFLSTSFDGPQQDDIRAVQRQYGDPFEPNNTAALAVAVGTLGTSGTTTIGTIPTTVPGDTIIYPTPANSSLVSIDANGENDFWSFNTTANVLATLSLTPIGSTYDDSDQLGGSCDSGNNINAAAISDLTLRVTNSTGVTTLAFQNAAASGAVESIPTFLLSGNSTYLLNVAEADAPTQSQLYRLTIQVTAATTLTASDAAAPNSINLSWTNIPGSTGYQIFRSTSNDFATAAEIAAPATNAYIDTGLPNGAIRFYWVKATQSVGGFSSNQFVGGPEQGSTSSPSNNAPSADAGADQSVRDPEGDGSQAVTLNGSGSTDSDGTITNYTWRENGSTVATGVNPTANFSAGVHTVVLTVTDDDGATDTDTVIITVTSNNAPTANAGGDETVTDSDNSGSESVNLSAAGSSDPDGSIVSYIWRENGDEIASGLNPTIFLPVGVHTIVLTVTDNEGRTDTDTVVITVEEGAPACPADFNGDGFLDFFDYDDFVNCYESGSCPPGKTADYNGDGFVDFFDYDDFVSAYELGC